MKSCSDKVGSEPVTDSRSFTLTQRLLVHLGNELGPALDVVDISDTRGASVRDLILRFAKEEPVASPAEVRAALLDLHDEGHVTSCGVDARWLPSGERPPSVDAATSEVRITCRGLVAARALEPDCGRPVGCVTFVTRKASPLLDVRWETGSKEWDKLLNGSPTITAVAFILLVQKPTREQPLLVEQCAPLLERLDIRTGSQFAAANAVGLRGHL